MSQEPEPTNISINFSDIFLRQIKRLEKKYPHITDDIQATISSLRSGELVGDRLVGADAEVYKVRIKNTDIRKGKSSGYRLVYYVIISSKIVLMTIYSKSEQEDIDVSEIQKIIAQIE